MKEKNGIRIDSIKAENFKNFEKLDCVFGGQVTHIVGMNGSGKTGLRDIIWAAIKGIAKSAKEGQLVGDRFNFIGTKGKTSKVEVKFVDVVANVEIIAKNVISKSGNNITFTAPEGYVVDAEWLKNLMSVAFMSAQHFTKRSPKDQALLLGIDTAEFDKEIAEIKDRAKDKRAEGVKMGVVDVPEKVEVVDLHKLYSERDEINAYNKAQVDCAYKKDSINQKINEYRKVEDETRAKIKSLKETLIAVIGDVEQLRVDFSEVPQPGVTKTLELTSISGQISEADEINKKASAYNAAIKERNQKDIISKELEVILDEQDVATKKKGDYVKAFDFKFDGLSVGDDSGLLLDGRPISTFSTAEREVIVMRLAVSQGYNLKFRFVDNFELLDAVKQQDVLDKLKEEGYQVVTTEVGENVDKRENTLLLRDGKIVDPSATETKNDKPKLL